VSFSNISFLVLLQSVVSEAALFEVGLISQCNISCSLAIAELESTEVLSQTFAVWTVNFIGANSPKNGNY